ncbi:unnamed protein product, partial [Trichogramma brassicae]
LTPHFTLTVNKIIHQIIHRREQKSAVEGRCSDENGYVRCATFGYDLRLEKGSPEFAAKRKESALRTGQQGWIACSADGVSCRKKGDDSCIRIRRRSCCARCRRLGRYRNLRTRDRIAT